MQVTTIDPPERGFYGKRIDVLGIAIKAHGDVADAALVEAGRRVERLLGMAPRLTANLASVGAELHVIGERQQVTDLPMYRHMLGVHRHDGKTMDERGRGYGGLHCCASEESILCLPTARHKDHRDITSHEFAHTIHRYGLDTRLQRLIDERFADAKPLWGKAYATTNADEFFAELTMWYVGSRGDFTSLPSPKPGPEWLARHDRESFALLHAIYSGWLEPEPIDWLRLEPTGERRSRAGGGAVTLLIVNETDEPLERFWLDARGRRKGYGAIQPGAAVGQATFAGHPWLLVDGHGDEVGAFVAERSGHALVIIGG